MKRLFVATAILAALPVITEAQVSPVGQIDALEGLAGKQPTFR